MELQKKIVWQWITGALLILIIPNILFWLLEPKVHLERGVFVAEYFLLACIYPFISRRFFIVIWILFAIYDLIFSTSSLFFMDFMELLHALAKIPNMPFTAMLKWGGLLILFIVIIYALLKLLMRYNASFRILNFRFLWPLIIFCLIINFVSSNKNIVSVPSWPFIKAAKYAIMKSTQKRNIEYFGSVAQKVFTNVPDSNKKEALILVESWGLLNNDSLQQELLQSIYALARDHRYAIKEGTSKYKYLTQAGEFREITGYLFHYYQVRDKWVQQNSILIKKQQQGYHVIGMHGNTSKFYRRHLIWPVLGVQEMYFAEDFQKMSMPLCGDAYFKGICDTSINTWFFNKVKKQPERKEFYYWVTLNTHLPIAEIHDKSFNRFAEKWLKQGISENVLQVAYQHKLYFDDLAGKLRDPLAQKMHILLIGDHSPPFIDPASRSQYNKTYVPYIELISE